MNPLLGEIWERKDLGAISDQTSYRMQLIPNLILTPTKVSLDSFRISCLREAANEGLSPAVWALSQAMPGLWAVRHLPAIHMWQKLLFARYMRRVSREECRISLTVQAVLDDVSKNNWGDVNKWRQAWE